LQPGVPSLGRCVTLLPATFCNLGLGDPLSSCNKRIVFISYSFFAWRTYGPARSQDLTRLGFCFAKLAYTETNRDDLKLLLDAEREDVVLKLPFYDLSSPKHYTVLALAALI
jgi:hypothetical protein